MNITHTHHIISHYKEEAEQNRNSFKPQGVGQISTQDESEFSNCGAPTEKALPLVAGPQLQSRAARGCCHSYGMPDNAIVDLFILHTEHLN